MSTPASESGFVRLVRGLVRFLMRLVLLVLFFGLIAAALYFGIPYVQRTYLTPLNEAQGRIVALETQVAALQTQNLEAAQALRQDLLRLQEAQQEQAKALQALQEQLQALEQAQNQGQQALDKATQERRNLAQRLDELQQRQETLVAQFQALDVRMAEWEALWTSQMPAFMATQRQVVVLRVMLHALRAGLFLAQDRYATARGELALALTFLQGQLPLMPDAEQSVWQTVQEHLQKAHDLLPEKPVQAQGELDAAWNVLSTLNTWTPYGPSMPTATPAPSPVFAPTPTPTPTP